MLFHRKKVKTTHFEWLDLMLLMTPYLLIVAKHELTINTLKKIREKPKGGGGGEEGGRGCITPSCTSEG